MGGEAFARQQEVRVQWSSGEMVPWTPFRVLISLPQASVSLGREQCLGEILVIPSHWAQRTFWSGAFGNELFPMPLQQNAGRSNDGSPTSEMGWVHSERQQLG